MSTCSYMINRTHFDCTSSSFHNNTKQCANLFNADPDKLWMTKGRKEISWVHVKLGRYYFLSKISMRSNGIIARVTLTLPENMSNIFHQFKLGWNNINIKKPYLSNTNSVNVSFYTGEKSIGISEIRMYGCPGNKINYC